MRIVQERIVPAGTGRFRSGEPGTNIKEYFDRVAKYVPAEFVAAYISANGVAALALKPGSLFILIFVACVVCTPLYITQFTTTRKEAWINGLMAVAAFIVWAYATGGGLVKYLGWYDAPTASVILVLFTLVSGVVVPVTKQKPAKPEIISNPPHGT